MGYYHFYEIGEWLFAICQQGEKITEISVRKARPTAEEASELLEKGMEQGETALIQRSAKQLKEYFEGGRKEFDLPLAPVGTKFQQKVWQALREIPYGETATYGQIARRIGNPKGARAVGMACNRNEILIVIPCHRVIGAGGKLVGFGCGLDMKEKLLNIERKEQTANV